ncbi:MAG: DUF3604 domain-containing protein [Gammaproteobacteria bacterium]|nr:DUF3604 domain-containing protein [Gammaproteobacteria bacterium]
MTPRLALTALFALLAAAGCAEQDLDDMQTNENIGIAGAARAQNSLLPVNREILEGDTIYNPDRNAYFGDLHVHTAYSFDAYVFGTTSTPDDAYRYAQGEPLPHPSGYEVQLQRPMDFYAVTDHAMLLGVVKESANTDSEFSRYEITRPLHNINAPDNMGPLTLTSRGEAFGNFLPAVLAGMLDGSVDTRLVERISKSAWKDTVRAANDAYRPGEFTTFAAFEYTTSTDDRGNLHRNVIFRDTDRLPAVPFSRFNSQNPEGLWQWMDGLREQGIESLAIPHNSNGSNGQMFKLVDWAKNPIDDDYAAMRLRNEPLVEMTQVKGTSDTHPLLSKNDEWADFEIAPYRVATKLYSEPAGSYVRDGLLRGLELQAGGVANPYKFGLIGSSDTHTGANSLDESSFFSKAGMIDGTPELRGSIPVSFLYGTAVKFTDPSMLTEVDGKNYLASSSFEYWSASGLAAVWAEKNTREAIYDAFRRKETFATTGPRIKVRFFAGYDFADDMLERADLTAKAYQHGVTMGSDLQALPGKAPAFLVWATADPAGTRLQRVQVIKGWLQDGKHHEQVYDVACSDGLEVDTDIHRCPDNGASVSLSDCSISAGVGASELKTLWRDPDFSATQEAFYYVRVLENPTCRWSTWDALNAGEEPRSDLPKTLQERAWSSPIWLRPSQTGQQKSAQAEPGNSQYSKAKGAQSPAAASTSLTPDATPPTVQATPRPAAQGAASDADIMAGVR